MVMTQGDDDPSNDMFFEGTFEVLADNGAHPVLLHRLRR